MKLFYKKINRLSAIFLLLGIFTTPMWGQCVYTANLFDTFGDGWNGAELSVIINGDTTILTIDDGDSFTAQIDIEDGDLIVLSYEGGVFENEVSYEIIDNNGNTIFSDGPNPGQGMVFQLIVSCSDCDLPQNIVIDEILGDGFELSFTPNDSAEQYIIFYGLQGLPFDSLNSITVNSATNVLVDGLLEDTTYQFFVGAICDVDNNSSIVGPFNFRTIFANDVGVTEITAPFSDCNLGLETITFNLAGFGSNLQSLFAFNYSVNGEMVSLPMFEDGFFTGVVGSNDTVSVSFDTQFDFSAPGEYEIAVWTDLVGDSNTENDTAFFSFSSIPTVDELPYFANFTVNSEGWSVVDSSQNNSWDFGSPNATIISSANSGNNAWVTNLSGDYNTNELSYVQSICFDFSTITETPRISLNINYITETNFDGGWLEGSKDGGITWERIGAMGTGINWYNVDDTFTDLGNVWAGESDGWLFAEHSLDGFAGEGDSRFRFVFSSDGSVTREGFGLDDIQIFIPLANDLQASSGSNSADPLCGSPSDSISITIINVGLEDQMDITVAYQVDEEPVVMEDLTGITIASGESLTYTFNTTFNSNIFSNEFLVKSWVINDIDENLMNDTTSFTFETSTPFQLPLVADFNDGLLPDGWETDGTIDEDHNNGSPGVYDNLFVDGSQFITTTPNVGPINPNDSLTFDYRYTDWSAGTVGTVLAGDSLIIEISNDCGETYSIQFVIDETNHITSAEYTNQTIDLNPFAGDVIRIRFRAVYSSGDYWMDLDNINIIGCPEDFDLIVNIQEPASGGTGDGGLAVFPQAGAEPFSYLWNTGDTTNVLTNIDSGEYSITVTDANGCEQVLPINLFSVGTEDIESLLDYSLFPNPTNGMTNLLVNFDQSVDVTVRISSLLGQTVYQQKVTQTRALEQQINTKDWSQGIYMIQIWVNGKGYSRKLIKQ